MLNTPPPQDVKNSNRPPPLDINFLQTPLPLDILFCNLPPPPPVAIKCGQWTFFQLVKIKLPRAGVRLVNIVCNNHNPFYSLSIHLPLWPATSYTKAIHVWMVSWPNLYCYLASQPPVHSHRLGLWNSGLQLGPPSTRLNFTKIHPHCIFNGISLEFILWICEIIFYFHGILFLAEATFWKSGGQKSGVEEGKKLNLKGWGRVGG